MKALLIVDVQNGLTARKLHKKELFIESINKEIDEFRSNNDLIIFVQHENKQLINGTKDWEIDNRMNSSSNDLFYTKTQGNAFSNETLVANLKECNISEILICGLVSHGCIAHTCRGGIELGFNIRLLKNGHTNWHKDAANKIMEAEKALEAIGINTIQIKQ
ncbi:MAG: isochorismatase family protein [Clostridiales bacterium]|nr:isochorismatase family protein [Clostridiales bacterium]